jgi:hypothetical protein
MSSRTSSNRKGGSGMTNEPEPTFSVARTIGRKVGLSSHQVNNHLEKYGLRFRGEPTAKAIREGWVESYTIQKGERGRQITSFKWREDWVINTIQKDLESKTDAPSPSSKASPAV